MSIEHKEGQKPFLISSLVELLTVLPELMAGATPIDRIRFSQAVLQLLSPQENQESTTVEWGKNLTEEQYFAQYAIDPNTGTILHAALGALRDKPKITGVPRAMLECLWNNYGNFVSTKNIISAVNAEPLSNDRTYLHVNISRIRTFLRKVAAAIIDTLSEEVKTDPTIKPILFIVGSRKNRQTKTGGYALKMLSVAEYLQLK